MAKRKKSNGFIKFLLFLIFLIIGIVGGYYIANEYLLKEPDDTPIATEIGDKDITTNNEFKATIDELYEFLNTNVFVYDSRGVTIATVDNGVKLDLAYDYVIENKTYTEETLNNYWWGSINCQNNFLVDSVTNEDGSVSNMNYCTVKIISKDSLNSAITSVFKSGSVEMVENYKPNDTTLCVIRDDGNYMCGKIVANTTTIGALTSKFEISKVTIAEDNTINIFDRGYLVDTRANIPVNTNYSNYYLHSYDSTEYYYELKSKDNLTFRHVFKQDENGKYYYYSSEVVK